MKRLACLILLLCLATMALSVQADGALELISEEELPMEHQRAVDAEMDRVRSVQKLGSQMRAAPAGYADRKSDGTLNVSYTVSASRVVVGQKVTFSVKLSCEESPMYITYSGLIMDGTFREVEEIAEKNYRSPYKSASASWTHTPNAAGHFCFVLVVSDQAGNLVSLHTNTVQVVELAEDPEFTSKAMDGSMTAIVTLDKKTLKVEESLTAQVAFLYDVDPIRFTGSWLLYDEQDKETLLDTFNDMVLTGGDTIMTYACKANAPGEIVFRLEAEDGEDNRVLLLTPGIPVKADRLPGDADEDGVVGMADAIRILEYAAAINDRINVSNADVDADGNVDIHDALLILQYNTGWKVTLL